MIINWSRYNQVSHKFGLDIQAAFVWSVQGQAPVSSFLPRLTLLGAG